MSVRHSAGLAAKAAALLLVAVAPAAAHTGFAPASGFAAGFLHPFGGLDHVLAMVAVGMLAALIGGRALWLVPASFVTAMAFGGALGMAQASLPLVEGGIAASVVVLGLAVALAAGAMPAALAAALAAAFAVFHGHAHGAEMPAAASGLACALGFAGATALLHASGLAAGIAAERMSRRAGRAAVQMGGGVIAVLGGLLFLA